MYLLPTPHQETKIIPWIPHRKKNLDLCMRLNNINIDKDKKMKCFQEFNTTINFKYKEKKKKKAKNNNIIFETINKNT